MGVSLVVFCGGSTASDIEVSMARVKQATTLDLIGKAAGLKGVDKVFLCTDYPELEETAGELGAEIVHSEKPFHFGEQLRQIIHTFGLERPLYIGGAGAPLLSIQELQNIVTLLLSEENCVIANNFQSADLIGFSPGYSIDSIPLPEADNSLAHLLKEHCKLKITRIPESIGTCFDIDTPTDIQILGVHPDCPPRVMETIYQTGFELQKMNEAKSLLCEAYTDVFCWGRINQHTLDYLNRFTRCRWRVMSEERGMKSLGRVDRGEVVSLLGLFLTDVGNRTFFNHISKVSKLAFIDSRVLFSHMGRQVQNTDRYYSDLGMINEIKDPFVKSFTVAAADCGIPVILGGHSLVTGGIRVLIDALWRQWERSKGLC